MDRPIHVSVRPILALALFSLLAGLPSAGEVVEKTRFASLEDLLPSADDVGPDWEITFEAGVTEMGADQQSWGVLETQARHYGRTLEGLTEICTVDLWRFKDAAHAKAAASGISYPEWSFEAKGALLITLRAARWQRGQPFQKGLFPDCRSLGALVRLPAG